MFSAAVRQARRAVCAGVSEGSAAVVEARYGQPTVALRKRLEQGLGQVKR